MNFLLFKKMVHYKQLEQYLLKDNKIQLVSYYMNHLLYYYIYHLVIKKYYLNHCFQSCNFLLELKLMGSLLLLKFLFLMKLEQYLDLHI